MMQVTHTGKGKGWREVEERNWSSSREKAMLLAWTREEKNWLVLGLVREKKSGLGLVMVRAYAGLMACEC